MKKIEVVAAIIYHEDKILCVQRPENKFSYISYKYEFPGGKIEAGETPEAALKREILEELGMYPLVERFFMTVEHTYADFELTMHSFVCKSKTMDLVLNEHISSQWLTKDLLQELDWAAADIPIVNKIIENG